MRVLIKRTEITICQLSKGEKPPNIYKKNIKPTIALPLHPGGPDAAGGVAVLGCSSAGARSDPDPSSFPLP